MLADEPDDQAELRSRRARVGCIAALAVFMSGLYYLGCHLLSPADWVEVKVGPLPRGSENFCVIAEDSQGVAALPWYHSKVFPDAMDPFLNGDLGGAGWDPDGDGFIETSVQWKDAKRYGVLVHRRDGEWRLYWLGPEATKRPSFFRYLFPGSGQASLQLPDEKQGAVLSTEFLRKLGWKPRENRRR